MTPPERTWKIHRLELCHLDQRHRRWQILQEFPEDNQPSLDFGVQVLHRRQIQQLLRTVRKYLNSKVQETCFTVGSVPKSSDIGLTIDPQDHLLQPILADGPEVWQHLLKYLELTADFQMIRSLKEIREELLQKIHNLNDAREVKLTVNAALDLLSILPWLPEWDTPGCWWRALHTAVRHAGDQSANTFPPVSDLASCRGSCYLARLYYEEPSPPTVDAPLSHQLLGYPVSFESLYKDLRVPYAKPLYCPPADFYGEGRCRNPDGPDRTNEGALYRFWAFFMDAIQKQIEGGAGQAAQATVNLLAYPIFSPTGWNFLHIYIRYTGDGEQLPIRRLWNDWWPVHESLMQHSFRSFLVETLDRIELTYFQARLKNRIEKEKRKVTDEVLATLLCGEAYTLFPARSLAVRSNVSGDPVQRPSSDYSGEDYYYPNASDSHRVYVGWQWKDKPAICGDADQTVKLATDMDVRVWRDSSLFTIEDPTLTAGRITQHLEQQYQVAKLSAEALRRMADELFVERKRQWDTRYYPQLVTQAQQVFAKLRHAETSWRAKFDGVCFMLDGEEVPPEEFFRPYFYCERLNSDKEPAWERAYRLLLTANGHVVISRYVETGVLYWLTHTDHAAKVHSQNQIVETFTSARQALDVIFSQPPAGTHVTCLKCTAAYANSVVKIIPTASISYEDLANLPSIALEAARPPKCQNCTQHEVFPEWLNPAVRPVTVEDSLADLAKMRERALRSPEPSDSNHNRLKLMFGLGKMDTLFVDKVSEPTIHIAPAGLKGWTDALDKFREDHGGLTAFFFAENEPLSVERNHSVFYGPQSFQKNYIALFKKLDQGRYDKLGARKINRLERFHSILNGLGGVYCMKAEKHAVAIAERKFYLMLPEWNDITALIELVAPAILRREFTELEDGLWEAVVIVLDRVKI